MGLCLYILTGEGELSDEKHGNFHLDMFFEALPKAYVNIFLYNWLT